MYSYINTSSNLNTKEHLDLDSHLLSHLDFKTSLIYLRTWEPIDYAVVLGRSNKANSEVLVANADSMNISVHKRCSGGGTVVLGPGCLCYSLYISTSYEHCSSISNTNSFVMNQNKIAISKLFPGITIDGFTDLVINNKKFSGNAQRRNKNAILFHGTILYNFDLSLISKLLNHPSKEPSYRKSRSHKDFIRNLNVSKESIESALIKQWACTNYVSLKELHIK